MSDVDSFDIGKRKENILRLLEREGPLKISQVSDRFNWDHKVVREEMNQLSKKHLIASLPGFEYEYVGQQNQKKP